MKAAIAVFLLAAAMAYAQPHPHGTSASLGTVEFQTSCAPTVHADFNHAVALLHSFEYDNARDEFLAVAKKDPGCAVAHWGAAMSYFHALWGEVEVEPGAKEAALAREIAAQNPKTTAREKQYIEAASAVYAQPDAKIRERAQAWSDAMAKTHTANPTDEEAAIFYALSLDAAAAPDPEYKNQRQCGEILEPLFRKMPSHPGVAHYLIHCYDNPVLAPKGLEAARAYARIAPDSPHATHMPSHIFVRLGMWNDNDESNLMSMRDAEHLEAKYPCQSRGSELHAMQFLQFGYLQEGRQKDAKAVVDRAMALADLPGCYRFQGEILADYILESHDWRLAEELRAATAAKSEDRSFDVLLTLGVAAARSGQLEQAREAESALAARQNSMQANPMMTGLDVVRRELGAWRAEAEGNHEEAVRSLRAAADSEDQHDPSAWSSPMAREMLGELLLQQGKNEEALAEFRAVLRAAPNLFLALDGAAKAAEAAGDQALALAYYRKLTEIAGKGDRPEVAAAKKKIEEAKGGL